MNTIETLEQRIAPATLVNPTTVKFVDTDGDQVTLHISKPLFTAENFERVLSFAPGAASLPGGEAGEYLQKFDVKQLGLSAAGLDIAIIATRSAALGGNGHVDIGNIDAFNKDNVNSVDLGRVLVDGDLDFIDAGDADLTTRGLKSLDVASIGEQADGIRSEINGSVGTVKIRGNMLGIWDMKGTFDSTVKSFTIGGSLGSSELVSDNAGSISLQGIVGKVKVGHNVIGGKGLSTGHILVVGSAGSIEIGGSVLGNEGSGSGGVQIAGRLDSVHVHGDVIGGSGESTGLIFGGISQGVINKVQVDGSLIGGTKSFTGVISADRVGSVTIGQNVIGRIGGSSGFVNVGTADSITVKGSLQGVVDPGTFLGGGNLSGGIAAAKSLGVVRILGDVTNANIIAGVKAGDDKVFGSGEGSAADADLNPGLISHIAKVIIGGAVEAAGASHFAIESNEIGIVKIGSVVYAHTDPALNFTTGFAVDAKGAVIVREI
jgi:hypothetical protein